MLNIPVWKKYLILLGCLFGILYSLPNVAGSGYRDWAAAHLPAIFPHKTVNLGLDLRGGAHLLYEVDVAVVFKDKTDSLLQDSRTELRKEKIGYSRIGVVENGIRLDLTDKNDGEGARKIIRRIDPNLDIKMSDGDVVLTAVFNEAGLKQIYDHTISQSIEIVRRRVDELGTTEPMIQRQGDNRILIQAPGANAESLKSIIGTTAKLNFHLVSESGGKPYPFAEDASREIPLERRAVITGEMLEGAQPAFQDGAPVISFRLNTAGARRFCDVTRKNVNKPFAIVLDNEVLSAPVIREPICGGQGQISGGFTVEEATNLALLLRAGALPAPMHVIEERTVGPSLGVDSVQAGKIASIIGLVFVLVFMVLSYGLFGLFADVALFVNVALIFAILSMLQATLTLPGIAGIVLTIGMAVDANVLVFERIREELKSGRSVISAIDAGYKNAMSTIIDSNLTTLIAGAILFSFGTGPIKGFAVTLSVGILTSMFSAIMVTRLVVSYWVQKRKPKELSL